MCHLEKKLMVLLEKIENAITAEKVKALQHIDGGDLPIRYFYYLNVIGETGTLSSTELAERLGLTKPAITAMVKRMIKEGCAYKEQSPDDRRVHFIGLTEKGAKIAGVYRNANIGFVQRIRRSLDGLEFENLVELLDKLKL